MEILLLICGTSIYVWVFENKGKYLIVKNENTP